MIESEEDILRRRAGALLAQAGLPKLSSLIALPGGANNRVFLAEHGEGRALLKAYFRHPDDPRDRLGAEFAFCDFAWRAGVRAVPRPLARDDRALLALYEFIEGRPCQVADVGAGAVLEAARFFGEINRNRARPEAARLPAASDACFSLADHSGLVSGRLKALEAVQADASVSGRQAWDFISGRLIPEWERVSCELARRWRAAKARETDLLTDEERMLSPSDFGFHNALLDVEGRLHFIDFEYAGWDDPAKMAADFFSQVSVPVGPEHFAAFFDEAMRDSPARESCRRRIGWVLPIQRFKWICLILNEFLPAARQRRKFARGGNPEERKARQLEKARQALEKIPESLSWPT